MPTSKHGIPYVDASQAISTGPTQINAALDALDAKIAVYDQGPLASRPTSTMSTPGITGRRYFATDAIAEYLDTGTGWVRVGPPAGALLAIAVAAAPAGYLLCDGAAVSRTGANADLFAALGTVFGAGNGSSTFNLPDLRGRVPVGVDGAAGRLTASKDLGQAGGAEKHQLTIGEMPSHGHDLEGADSLAGSGPALRTPHLDTSRATNWAIGAGNTNGRGVQNAGGGGQHNNMQPYLVVNWAIKT